MLQTHFDTLGKYTRNIPKYQPLYLTSWTSTKTYSPKHMRCLSNLLCPTCSQGLTHLWYGVATTVGEKKLVAHWPKRSVYYWAYLCIHHLVAGVNLSEKYDFVSWDDDYSQLNGKIEVIFQSPPTRSPIVIPGGYILAINHSWLIWILLDNPNNPINPGGHQHLNRSLRLPLDSIVFKLHQHH